MTRVRVIFFMCVWSLCLFNQCVEPYEPHVNTPPDSYLVVNTFVGNTDAVIELKRSQAVNDEDRPKAEAGAQVTIETEAGVTFSLAEESPGRYVSSGMNMTTTDRCRLRIKTSDGKEYESVYVPVLFSPEIDSISWGIDADGLNVYVNTHDPANNTHFYLWEYEETIHYRSAYRSSYIINVLDDTLEFKVRTGKDDIFNCWITIPSDNILLGNSSRLSRDIITNHRLVNLPANSWKHGIKYSLLVRQYALSRDAFNYFENLKRTTEDIGSLFGPLPANVEGNIRCVTNPAEPVVGYFNISTVTEKRIFIDSSELPVEWLLIRTGKFSIDCYASKADTLLLHEIFANPDVLLINAVEEGGLIGFTSHKSISCIDCRLNGGTNVRPDFWE